MPRKIVFEIGFLDFLSNSSDGGEGGESSYLVFFKTTIVIPAAHWSLPFPGLCSGTWAEVCWPVLRPGQDCRCPAPSRSQATVCFLLQFPTCESHHGLWDSHVRCPARVSRVTASCLNIFQRNGFVCSCFLFSLTGTRQESPGRVSRWC